MRLFSVETFHLGLRNLWLHKLRSLLTSLGIIFGVAAVICMLSISEGASAEELRMIELLGTRNIIVNSVKPEEGVSTSDNRSNMLEYGITYEDVDVIRETIPHIETIVPLKTVAPQVRVGERRMSANVVGTTPDYFKVVNIEVGHGRTLLTTEMEGDLNICIIGHDVADALFPLQDPLGQTLVALANRKTVPLEVVGVLREVSTAGAPERGVEERNVNREIYIPLPVARMQFGEMNVKRQSGSREITKVNFSGLYVTVKDLVYVLPVSEMVRRVFEFKHDKHDYEVKVPLARLKLAEQKKRNNQLILGFIAGISLLVGGIGIMNIMLATVTERTREIGIRRALGAKQWHITVQFLVETVVLSTTGGLAGVLLGVLGSRILSHLADWDPIVSLWAVALSFGLSVLVGIFFGMYPAMSAAKLDPIEALRHE